MLTIKEIKSLWNEPGRQIIAVLMLVFTLMSFFIGLIGPPVYYSQEAQDKVMTCKANSIYELINVPYRLGCEMVKERWPDDE